MEQPVPTLYTYVNRFKLPKELQQYYKFVGKPGNTLEADIYRLKSLLLKYRNRDRKEEINTAIFLAIIGYYIGHYRLTLYFIRQLEAESLEPVLKQLLLELKYNIRILDKVLVITSEDATYMTSLRKVASYANRKMPGKRKKLVILKAKNLTFRKLAHYFKSYEQVFLVGHGDDRVISLGKKEIGLPDIASLLQGQFDKPNVVGIFSCGNAFRDPSIWEHVDFFMTDNQQSVPVFAEMFLYGYLRNFYNFFSVQRAYDAGNLLPTIRAVNALSIELYAKGDIIRL